MHIDIFNGDADGICALVQLRLAKAVKAKLVTGVKRDIALLHQLDAHAGDKLTVLDISLAKNHTALLALLAKSVKVLYVDHHQAGEIPLHAHLTALIDTDANICTSLIVNRHLQHCYPAWAVTGAFGDNLNAIAYALAKAHHFTRPEIDKLRNLGVWLNYNAYGATLADLHIHPAELYQSCVNYSSPLDFIGSETELCQQLRSNFTEDLLKAKSTSPSYQTEHTAIYILPDEAWVRRGSGVFSNELANQDPQRAHAVLSEMNGYFQVSVRAPLSNKLGADSICSAFSTGGGRSAAAGINQLPYADLHKFISVFTGYYESNSSNLGRS